MYKILTKKEFMKSISRLSAGKSWNEKSVRILLQLLRSGIVLPWEVNLLVICCFSQF